MIIQSVDRRRGFTLIELLVVISIIALLIAILLPVLANAREAARQSQCLSRVRQMGMAMQLYVDEYGRYPIIDRSNRVVGGDMWCERLSTYLNVNWLGHTNAKRRSIKRSNPVWICPSDDDAYKIGYGPNYPNIVAYEAHRSSGGTPFNRPEWQFDQITRPSSIMGMIEIETGLVPYAFTTFQASVDRDKDGVKDTNLYIESYIKAPFNNIAPRHHGRANLSFLDGHADTRHIRQLATNEDDIWGRDLFGDDYQDDRRD